MDPEAPASVPQPPAVARGPIQPGDYSGSTNPQTPDEWNNATTRSLELMKGYSPDAWAAGTKRTPVEIGGVRQKLIESTTTPGLYVGYIDAAGNIVPVGSDVSPEQFVELVTANAAEAPPDWGDVAEPTAAATPTAATPPVATDTAAIPPPVESLVWTGGDTGSSGGGGSRSGGSGWIDYGDNDGFGSSGRRWNDYGDDDNDFDAGRDFTADDFMEAAKGDRRKAQMMARAANRKRGKGKRGGEEDAGRGFWPGFPWNRPPSPIRELVLAAIQESKAQGNAKRGKT